MRASVAEVDQDDDCGDRQTVADDRDRPRVAGVAFVHEAADRAALDVMHPAREERPFSAVWTAFRDTATQRGEDHDTPVSVMSKTSVAFGGIAGDGLRLPYASSGGMIKRRCPPMRMPGTPRSHPAITWPAPTVNVKPAPVSNCVPLPSGRLVSYSQPV